MRGLMLGLLCGAGVLGFAGSAAAQQGSEVWRLGGFKTPESVLQDPANDRIIVGNMVTFGPDGGTDGYLSLVSLDGKLLEEKWVTGLMDPKGMGIVGDKLFVADMNGLVEISLADGSIVKTHTLEGAMFPNDVAVADNGDVYVSDMMGSAIYKVSGGSIERWVDVAPVAPNGLIVLDDKLIIGSIGEGLKPDFSTDKKGGLLSVDLASKAVTPLEGATEIGMVDGVGLLNDSIVFNDNPSGTIYAYRFGEPAKVLVQVPQGSADLSVNGDMIYSPQMQAGEIVAVQVK